MATFFVGIATGAGIPSAADLNRYKAAKADVIRCAAVNWTDNGGGTTFPASSTRNAIDAFVLACNAKGLRLILGVNGGDNSSGNGGPGMNGFSTDFAAFVAAVAARYQKGSAFGVIEALEVGNEPNRHLWDNSPDPAEYAHLMSLAYAGVVAIGANRPLVMIGGIAGDPTSSPTDMSCADWTTGMYAATPSIKGNYDLWNTHRYTDPYTPSESIAAKRQRGWLAATAGLPGAPGSQKIREMNGDGAKPHACTEYGISMPFPGLWTSATDYASGDSAAFGGIVYDCLVTHSHTTPHQPPNATYWNPTTRPWQDETRWVAVADDAIALYAAEPTACYFCYFTDYDKKNAASTSGGEKSDASNWRGLWLDDQATPKITVYPEYQRLTTWRPSAGSLHTNDPSEWSTQDLGWAIPNSDFHWAATTAGRNRMKRVLDRIVASKSKLLRTEAYWASVQSAQSDARVGWSDTLNNTAFLDELFDACETRGIYIVLTHTYSPGWANGGKSSDHYAPLHPEDYANAAWCLADRYQTRNPNVLIMFEWWNEPNISQFWKDTANPGPNGDGPHVGHYTSCLVAASKVCRTGILDTPTGQRVRTAHPEIMVANGGLSPASGTGGAGSNYSPLNFVHGIIAGGGATYMDVFLDHCYMWQCPADKAVTWNPFVQLPDCLAALKPVGGPLDTWTTETGIISRPDVSGTDTGAGDCGVGGYSGKTGHVAPGGGTYNTSDRAVTYTLAADRVASYVTEWRSARFYDVDPAVNRQVTGPMFLFRLNDQAVPTDWGFDENHFGVYEYGTDSTDGPAKPFANEWLKRFANQGGPNSSSDAVPPTTQILTVDGVDVTGGGGLGFPLGLALGAGIPSTAELDRAKAIGADFVRCGIEWDAGSSGVDSTFDKQTAITNAVAHANAIGLGFLLTIGSGPTYNGSMYTHDFNGGGFDVVVEFAGFAAQVIRHFNGVAGDSNYVLGVEILNECNHAKINDPWLDPAKTIPNPNFIPWVHDSSYPTGPLGPERYAEIFIRIVSPDWEDVRATANCPPVVTTGLGGEHDSKGLPSYDFAVAIHQTVTFAAHTYTGGLWSTAGGADPMYDAFNDHPYTRPKLPSQDGPSNKGGWWNLQQMMLWFLANRGSLPPFYITEFGQPTNPENPTTLQFAADAMTDIMSLLETAIANDGWNLLGFAWFTMLNNNKGGLPPGAGDNDMGLLHYNADPALATPKLVEYDKFVEFATTGGTDPAPITVSGVVTLGIFASDNVVVERVEVLLDGNVIDLAAYADGDWTYDWDSATTTDGPHALRTRAFDLAGNDAFSTIINVKVANGAGTDTDPPTVTLIGVADGDTLSGPAALVTVHAVDVNTHGAPDPDPTTQILVDRQIYPGLPIRADGSGNPDPSGDYYQFFIDVTALTNGTHTLRGISTDHDGNTGRSTLISFVVDNGSPPDDLPPTVYLTYPNTDAIVSGLHAVFNAFAHDDVDPIVPTVELWITERTAEPAVGAFTMGVSELGGPDMLGGGGEATDSGFVPFGEGFAPDSSTNPLKRLGKFVPTGGDTYLLLWNSLTVANGDYQVQPKAIDSALNVTWGPPIHILVNNVPTPPIATGVDNRFPWRAYVREGDTWARLAVLDGYDELDLTIVEMDVGAWTLRIPNANPAVPFLLRDRSGIVVYKRDQVVFSGDTSQGKRNWDTADQWEFTGVDDMAWIADEIAHPAPGDTAPDVDGKWSSGNDTRGPGHAETLIRAYLDANIGPSAIAARRIPGLALAADGGRGAIVGPYIPRFDNLLVVLRTIATAGGGGLGFRILTDDNPVFSVGFPADRSSFVRFAAQLGKLKSFSYDFGSPDANVVYSGGQGTGGNRKYAVAADSGSIARWRRKAIITEHTDAADLTALAAAAAADLASNSFVPTLAVEPKDVPNAQFIDDYGLRDIVSVVLPERETFADRIVSVAIKFDASGVTIKPAVGATPRDVLRVMTEARRLRIAVDALQST